MPLPTITVEMGRSVTLISNNAILSTGGLTECSALAVLSNWNGRNYDTRTLMHLAGSNLECGLWGTDAYSLIADLKYSLGSYGKVIFVSGISSSSNFGISLILGQYKNPNILPLVDILNTPNIPTIIAVASGISIQPNGDFTLPDNGRGVLNEPEVKAIYELI
ncbi:hypothetical protein [Pseudomonas marginalis]|uniref:hypothetical protein n=1 Tax=Pseudomonas marginalis TaxID=298 RepID=UPI003BA144CF